MIPPVVSNSIAHDFSGRDVDQQVDVRRVTERVRREVVGLRHSWSDYSTVLVPVALRDR